MNNTDFERRYNNTGRDALTDALDANFDEITNNLRERGFNVDNLTSTTPLNSWPQHVLEEVIGFLPGEGGQ